ncbi:MAG: GntR family transcriptional regulator [Bacillaceae bacterium]
MAVKYKLVVSEMEKEILAGKYNFNSKLPTEEELMKKFNVSRNTIRKAIEVLAEQGYIYQVQGSGIFLREFSKPGCITMRGMKGLTNEFSGDVLTSELLELNLIEANEELAKKMKCEVNTKVYHVIRVRYLNGESFAVEESFFNKDIIPYLNKEICDSSIYKYITDDLKLNIGFADKVIYSEKLTEKEAKLLDLEAGDPTLVVENTVFLNTGAVFDVSREKFNYKRAKLLSLATN